MSINIENTYKIYLLFMDVYIRSKNTKHVALAESITD